MSIVFLQKIAKFYDYPEPIYGQGPNGVFRPICRGHIEIRCGLMTLVS